MDRRTILARLLEDPSELRNFQWQGESGPVQVYQHLPTGNTLAVDADTTTFYDQRMQEMHSVDAFAAVGIYSPNPIITEQIHAHVHEGREDVFARSIAPATGGPIPQYQSWNYESRGSIIDGEVYLEQHRYTGGLIYRDHEDRFVSFTDELRALSKYEALAGVVNYGPSDGTLEKLPPVDVEIIRPPAPEPAVTMSTEEYQALRSEKGSDWKHSVRVETALPELDGHYVTEVASLPEKYQDRIYDANLYVYNDQLNSYSPQLYDSMLAMNGPDWKHRVVVGPEDWYTHAETHAAYDWQRTAPEQDRTTALSVEAAYPKSYVAPTYEQALERWEAAVHLHEDLRGRPLTPQEYQQQVEINGPHWQHDVVMAQPVDGAQNIYDRPYTQITPSDQTLSLSSYERLLEHNGPEWQHSVLVRERFPIDPDSRFQEAHRGWLAVNDMYREQHGVPIGPQEYQAHHEHRDWHENSVVIVAPPLEAGLQRDDRAVRTDAEMSQMQSMSHPEYQELVRANGPEWRHSVIVLESLPEHYGFQLPTSWRDGPRIEHDHDLSEPQITPYARTDWTVEPGGGWEHRIHYGKSNNGYHYATEVSYNGGDMGSGELAWSSPHASQTAVKEAAHEAIAQLFPNDLAHDNGLSL